MTLRALFAEVEKSTEAAPFLVRPFLAPVLALLKEIVNRLEEIEHGRSA